MTTIEIILTIATIVIGIGSFISFKSYYDSQETEKE